MSQTKEFPGVGRKSVSVARSNKTRVAARSQFLAAPVLVVLVGFGIFHGIHSRVEAEAALDQLARASATPMVEVVRPKAGTDGQEIALPGNAQAFTFHSTEGARSLHNTGSHDCSHLSIILKHAQKKEGLRKGA